MQNKDKIILDLCGGTGSWSNPYKEAGYDVKVITLPEYDVEKWKEYPELVNLIKNNKIYGILAAPPCTMFSYARNNKTAKIPRNLREGMKTVVACLEIIWECSYEPFRLEENNLKFWALENPRGYLKRFLGNPFLEFDPFEYGNDYTKKTHIWGNFNLPKKNIVSLDKYREFKKNFVDNVQHFYNEIKVFIPDGYKQKVYKYLKEKGTNQAYSDFEMSTVRSITPDGFAKAFFEANK